MKRSVVTFLSDYGLQDEFVGVCKGVMLKIAPDLRLVDIHHYILRQDIRHGAIVLQQSVGFMPESVHLAVVDPSVGSERKAIAVETQSGQTLVGPDNGLLMPAVDRCGGFLSAVEITNDEYMLSPVSHTFQGRDVFAPAAAHLANGVEPSAMGPALQRSELQGLEIPKAWVHDDHLHAEVLQVDRFGNLQLNFTWSELEEVGLGRDTGKLEVRMEGHRLNVTQGSTFADVVPGDFVLVEDSYSQLSLAVNKGDAGAFLRAGARSTVIIGPLNS
jgi:S-adenosylmethionine hydrolase